ncbi:hypothetical protein LCGC14_2893640 [marine sediment metagenome]|uniref:Uncharacterized protein n=1 Tax=marine sediment metagenome TaxID=412755 RepID=A0A0F8XWW0_9ZZZZ
MYKLDGFKTHIQALLIGLASAAHYMGWVDLQAYLLILGLLGAGTVSSLHHAITRASTPTTESGTPPANETE